jgi:arginase family enzyme
VVGPVSQRLSLICHPFHNAGLAPGQRDRRDAGNCNSCLGTTAGLDPRSASLGVVWFDAHPDFDTPDRSLGFFDGMGLAILTGSGNGRMAHAVVDVIRTVAREALGQRAR